MKIDFSTRFYFAQLSVLFSARSISFFAHFQQKWLLIDYFSLFFNEVAGLKRTRANEGGGGRRVSKLKNLEGTYFLNVPLGVKYKDGICAELCLKLRVQSERGFFNITESGWPWKRLSRNKVPSSCKSVQKQPYSNVLQNRCFTKITWQENICVVVSFQ